mgnify:CR=1 FL=1
MLPNIPWNGITGKGILVGFLLAGIIGYLANHILWKSGVKPVGAFFKPQTVSHPTKKTPFQVLLGMPGRHSNPGPCRGTAGGNNRGVRAIPALPAPA